MTAIGIKPRNIAKCNENNHGDIIIRNYMYGKTLSRRDETSTC